MQHDGTVFRISWYKIKVTLIYPSQGTISAALIYSWQCRSFPRDNDAKYQKITIDFPRSVFGHYGVVTICVAEKRQQNGKSK